VRRLLPHPADDVSVEDAYGTPHPLGPGERPFIALCMVSSLDGSTALRGVSGSLSSDTDRAVLATLRRTADIIVVGAGTVRAEGYGPPRKPGQRLGVVTSSGRVDTSTELFTSGAGFLIMPEDAPDVGVESVRAGTGELDLAAALGKLPGSPRSVQAEGGPALNGRLFAAGLIDELNVTTAPLVAGGDGARLAARAPELGQRFALHELYEDDGFLFARWRRAADNLR
jgi:riboflavin biosynthesis pyrimidine reductase